MSIAESIVESVAEPIAEPITGPAEGTTSPGTGVDNYLRPGGTDLYFRDTGTPDIYLRP